MNKFFRMCLCSCENMREVSDTKAAIYRRFSGGSRECLG